MNWAAISQLTGWLPGASVGGLIGGLGAILGWEDIATDRCPIGSSSLTLACTNVLGFEFTSGTEFAAAGLAVGGIVGALVNAVVVASSSGAED